MIQKAKHSHGQIYAQIRGTAVVQDGRSLSFASPNPDAQVQLLERGLRNAKCEPHEVSYVEGAKLLVPLFRVSLTILIKLTGRARQLAMSLNSMLLGRCTVKQGFGHLSWVL